MKQYEDLFKPYEREAPMATPPFALCEVTPGNTALREEILGDLCTTWQSEQVELAYFRNWLRHPWTSTMIERRAIALAETYAQMEFWVGEHEVVAGRYLKTPLSETDKKELEHHRKTTQLAAPQMMGQDSHMAIDYDLLLAKGCQGVHAEVTERLTQCDESTQDGMKKAAFYRASLIALEGVRGLQLRFATEIEEKAAKTKNPERKAQLERMAAALQRVPWEPAQTFFEAVQSIHLFTFAYKGLYQFGRPDQYLLPYYRKDMEQGRLTPDEAQEIIDCFAILFSDIIPSSLAIGYMVGGTRYYDGAYHPICNELTWHFIHAVRHTRMAFPGTGLCIDPGTPESIIDLAAQCLGEGLSHPALFNDETIRRGLLELGLSHEQACFYIHSTCVEITPCACSAVWVASPYHNLPQYLLDTLENGQGLETFEGLLAAYKARLEDHIAQEVVDQNRLQWTREGVGGHPLVSCFVRGCVESGRDVDWGGAKHNWIMPSFVGVANLGDALVALNHLVYGEKRLTVEEMRGILKENFEGNEALRQEITNRYPKYGNGDLEADGMVETITRWIREAVATHTTYYGDKVVASLFCWIMHGWFGERTGATPDGRLSGMALGDGSGPAQGREKAGPTASILSSTCWPHHPFIGGIAVNIKLQKKLFEDSTRKVLLDMIRTFMVRGGFEIQVNAVDAETLMKAKKNPEKYADLVVRIGGYSDYFVRLTPQLQEEVITRTGHAL